MRIEPRYLILTFLLLILQFKSFTLQAQGEVLFYPADSVARNAPADITRDAGTLSDYFLKLLPEKSDLLRAFYVWTTHEISYDVANMYTPPAVNDPEKLVRETLRSRKAVCQGYAELFHALCRRAGIETYLVTGYTKQYGQVMPLNHTWVVAGTDSGWYFFDPTWGSGHVTNQKFTRRFNPGYFMVSPEKMAESHMPFDPMWQCLTYPYSSADFYRGTPPDSAGREPFRYQDTIRQWLAGDDERRYESTLRRVKANGIVNQNLSDYASLLNQNLHAVRMAKENDLRNAIVRRFNQAVYHHNRASLLFNDYVGYFNKQFKPAKPDGEIAVLLDSCMINLSFCREILLEIIPREAAMEQNRTLLMKSQDLLEKQVGEHREFIRQYLAMPLRERARLFVNYRFSNQ